MSKIGVLIWRKLFEKGDEKRITKQKQDISDLMIMKDIAYIDDDEQGHLLDVYRLPTTDETAPVMINIHGGGLFASYKEVNAHFNYEWARMGYRVVSINYRRIPETTLWHQIDDVMSALRFIRANADTFGLNLDRCYLTGDSAGALLSLFALSINGSEKLQKTFGIKGTGIRFRAAGLISIMLDTQRLDLHSLSNMVTNKADKGKAYEKYLLGPVSLLKETELPPLYLVTSKEDVIRKDTMKLKSHLTSEYRYKYFSKNKGRKLLHVFSVAYPMYPESKEVFQEMDSFFKEH